MLAERGGTWRAALTIQDKVALGRGDYPSADEPSGERDRLLVEAHLRRDPDAFAIIVDDHRDALVAQARRMLGPDGAAEDIVQETFERALKYLPRFGRSGEYRLGAWLSRILKSVVQNHWERKARELRSVQAKAGHAELEPDVAERVGDPVMAAALSRAVRALPDNQRAAFVMREVVGLPYADVAEALEISEDNARARVSRSKVQLRRTTAAFKSAAGALVSLPVGLRALNARVTRGLVALHRGKGHVLETSDRVATQLSASAAGQTALTLVSTGVPRGTLVFGLAATVATLSASTVVLVGSSTHPVASGVPNTALVADLGHSDLGAATTLTAPALTPSAVPPTTTGPTAPSPYAWANPQSSSGAPAASLPAGTCVPSDGVAPPAAGFTFGSPLGLANAQLIANTPAVDLSTTGSSLAFSSTASVIPFGADNAISFGAANAPATIGIESNVCLSSTGSWLTASVSGLSETPIELQGTLQMVVGTTGDEGYVFRGTIAPAQTSGPLAGVVQFVADVSVLEPDNTAQITVVFLSADAATATSVAPTAQTGSPSQVDGSQGDPSSPTSEPAGTSGATSSSVVGSGTPDWALGLVSTQTGSSATKTTGSSGDQGLPSAGGWTGFDAVSSIAQGQVPPLGAAG